MIEIPEAQVLAKQSQKILANKKIIDVTKEKSPHKFAFFNKEISSYADILKTSVIKDVKAYAGYVEFNLGEYHLTFSEGINLRYITHESDIPPKHQLLLHFSDNTYLVASIQMYGVIWLFKGGAFDNPYYLVAKEKPSPLSDEFSKEYFFKMIDSVPNKISSKAFLATEQRIPGLGNGVLQDILFLSKIHPKRKIGSLSSQEKETLFKTIKTVLQTMVTQGGRNTEKDLFGNIGQYKTLLSAKTYKKPCPICQGIIIKKSYLGGSIYYCPVCQPE